MLVILCLFAALFRPALFQNPNQGVLANDTDSCFLFDDPHYRVFDLSWHSYHEFATITLLEPCCDVYNSAGQRYNRFRVWANHRSCGGPGGSSAMCIETLGLDVEIGASPVGVGSLHVFEMSYDYGGNPVYKYNTVGQPVQPLPYGGHLVGSGPVIGPAHVYTSLDPTYQCFKMRVWLTGPAPFGSPDLILHRCPHWGSLSIIGGLQNVLKSRCGFCANPHPYMKCSHSDANGSGGLPGRKKRNADTGICEKIRDFGIQDQELVEKLIENCRFDIKNGYEGGHCTAFAAAAAASPLVPPLNWQEEYDCPDEAPVVVEGDDIRI